MSARIVAAAAALVVAVAGPSYAAPDRTAQLTRRSPTVSWTTDPVLGTYAGVPALHTLTRCAEPALSCDETLLEFGDGGTLTIDVTRSDPARIPYLGFDVHVYASDADGTRGKAVFTDAAYSFEASMRTADLTRGFYLVEISSEQGAMSFETTVSLRPSTTARGSSA